MKALTQYLILIYGLLGFWIRIISGTSPSSITTVTMTSTITTTITQSIALQQGPQFKLIRYNDRNGLIKERLVPQPSKVRILKVVDKPRDGCFLAIVTANKP